MERKLFIFARDELVQHIIIQGRKGIPGVYGDANAKLVMDENPGLIAVAIEDLWGGDAFADVVAYAALDGCAGTWCRIADGWEWYPFLGTMLKDLRQ